MLPSHPRRTYRLPLALLGLLALLAGLAPSLLPPGRGAAAQAQLALATTPSWTATGDQAGANLGFAVATAGDVNGDTYADVIVGAPFYGGTDRGRALVYLGGAGGLALTPAWTVNGAQDSSAFGWSVAPAGDVNNDGFADVLVGAPNFDSGGALNAGQVTLYLGSATGLSTVATWTATGAQASENFGFAVATAGDVNNDGFADLLVGAPNFDNGQTNEGRIALYRGGAAGPALVWSAESNVAGALLGWSVASAGDVNNDGFADAIAGAPELSGDLATEGRAYLYLGGAGAPDATADWSAEGNQAGAVFGRAVGTAGDVNGDTYADVVVGAPNFDGGQNNEGRAFVYLGGAGGLSAAAAWTAESNAANANFGTAVGTAGDVNGDTYADVVVGAPELSTAELNNEGRAYTFLGGAGGLATTAAWTVEGDQAEAILGRSAGTAGDVNGDGAADVIVGAYLFSSGALAEAGQARVYLGEASAPPDGPTVKGITLADPNPTRAASLSFVVTFSSAVTGVDITDFTLTASGIAGASVSAVAGEGASWTVTVASGSGSGALRLNVADNDTILDVDNIPLGGPGQGNGRYTTGPSYTIDRAPPTVAAFSAGLPARGSAELTFTVTYSDNLQLNPASLGNGDIVVSGPGGYSQAATIVSVAGQGAVWTAAYRVGAPGGAWGIEDEGDYSFSLTPENVSDSLGNVAEESVIGSLTFTTRERVFLALVQVPLEPGVPDLVVTRISLDGDGVAVTIRNQGTAAITSPFWVDLYINPDAPPTTPNQTWQLRGRHGAAWGIRGGGLPLDPGESLTLRLGDAFYVPAESNPTANVAAGSRLYAQADSANVPSAIGAILERDELPNGGPYNNIARLDVAAASPLGGPASPAGLSRQTERGELPARHR